MVKAKGKEEKMLVVIINEEKTRNVAAADGPAFGSLF